MRGSLWQIWIFGTIAAFIAVMSFYTFTPFFEDVTTSALSNVDFTPTINTSTTNTFNNMKYYWTLWPIAMIVIIMILFFIVATDDEQSVRR